MCIYSINVINVWNIYSGYLVPLRFENITARVVNDADVKRHLLHIVMNNYTVWDLNKMTSAVIIFVNYLMSVWIYMYEEFYHWGHCILQNLQQNFRFVNTLWPPSVGIDLFSISMKVLYIIIHNVVSAQLFCPLRMSAKMNEDTLEIQIHRYVYIVKLDSNGSLAGHVMWSVR